jgi:hypothetical protein
MKIPCLRLETPFAAIRTAGYKNAYAHSDAIGAIRRNDFSYMHIFSSEKIVSQSFYPNYETIKNFYYKIIIYARTCHWKDGAPAP